MLENCPLQTQLFQSLITYVEDNSRNTLSSNQELSRDSCLCWFWIIIADKKCEALTIIDQTTTLW